MQQWIGPITSMMMIKAVLGMAMGPASGLALQKKKKKKPDRKASKEREKPGRASRARGSQEVHRAQRSAKVSRKAAHLRGQYGDGPGLSSLQFIILAHTNEGTIAFTSEEDEWSVGEVQNYIDRQWESLEGEGITVRWVSVVVADGYPYRV